MQDGLLLLMLDSTIFPARQHYRNVQECLIQCCLEGNALCELGDFLESCCN